MHISTEGKLGILVGLLSLAGAGAVMVAPQHTEIGWSLIAIAAIGGIALAWHHFSRSLTANGSAPSKGMKLTTLGLVLSTVGVGFYIIGMALIFIDSRQSTAKVSDAERAIQNLAAIVTPGVKSTEKQERVFVPPEVTPERLFSFYRDNTAIQANELTKQYIGQWMKIDGRLNDVNSSNNNFTGVTFQHRDIPFLEREWFDYTAVNMYFREHIDRLKGLKRGDELSVIGEIKEIYNVLLTLDNCELVNPD
jgi:hypothetical protein